MKYFLKKKVARIALKYARRNGNTEEENKPQIPQIRTDFLKRIFGCATDGMQRENDSCLLNTKRLRTP